MIDTIIKILDDILSFRRVKKSDRKDMFKNIIEPMFEEMQRVHNDYIKMFEDALVLIEADKIDTAKKSIIENRKKLISIRQKLVSMESEISEDIRDKEKAFFESILSYFTSTGKQFVAKSVSTTMIEYFEREQSQDNLKHKIEEILYDLNQAWLTVCKKYNGLRLSIWK